MHTEREHARARRGNRHAAGSFHAVQFGHGNVHDDHVRLQFFGQIHGFPSVARLTDDFHIGLRRQDHLESLPHHRVIVSQHDADFLSH